MLTCARFGCDHAVAHDPHTDWLRCPDHGKVFGVLPDERLKGFQRVAELRWQQARVELGCMAQNALSEFTTRPARPT